jgi:hypothetical protein
MAGGIAGYERIKENDLQSDVPPEAVLAGAASGGLGVQPKLHIHSWRRLFSTYISRP